MSEFGPKNNINSSRFLCQGQSDTENQSSWRANNFTITSYYVIRLLEITLQDF